MKVRESVRESDNDGVGVKLPLKLTVGESEWVSDAVAVGNVRVSDADEEDDGVRVTVVEWVKVMVSDGVAVSESERVVEAVADWLRDSLRVCVAVFSGEAGMT